jgi:hypothetical protein
MPIFENVDGRLAAMRSVRPGSELYEKEVEQLVWDNLESFYGGDLFPLARQPVINRSSRPDVLALDPEGRVVVFEVKRAIDRTQLAQCLEYAGWARRTNLDELSALYHRGREAFFADWQTFTGTATPAVVHPSPILVLVAQDFDNRTSDALDFLADSDVPVYKVPAVVYENSMKQRVYMIESDFNDGVEESEPGQAKARRSTTVYRFRGRRLALPDLVEFGFVRAGEPIEFRRTKDGPVFRATITGDGQIVTADGASFDSLSKAAASLCGLQAIPGWNMWVAPERGGKPMAEIRAEFIASVAADS